MRTNSVLVPLTDTASFADRACAPNTLPVRRWQARHWQTDTRNGSAVTRAGSRPQLQEAVLGDMAGPDAVAASKRGALM
jgi:hypothetical protein